MSSMHPSETARLVRSITATPSSGSIEEQEALRAIDQARFEEENPMSRKTRNRRHRRHWSDREHALEGR